MAGKSQEAYRCPETDTWWASAVILQLLIADQCRVPLIAGVLSAAAQAEGGQERLDEMQKLWLKEHEEKIVKRGTTIAQILERLKASGDDVLERIQSEEYLALIRKGSKHGIDLTQKKRGFIRKLLSNAGPALF